MDVISSHIAYQRSFRLDLILLSLVFLVLLLLVLLLCMCVCMCVCVYVLMSNNDSNIIHVWYLLMLYNCLVVLLSCIISTIGCIAIHTLSYLNCPIFPTNVPC